MWRCETANNARGLEVGLLSLTESYRPREIRFLDLWELPGWRAKVYGIAHHSRVMPDGAMAGHVRAMALDRLSSLEINQHYGLAVIIIHMARETDIVSITWWTWENVLEQALFIGPPGEPARLKDVTGQGLLACVWELQIHHFESLAWLRTVLSNPQGPDLDAYLSQRFRAVV
jgi:hypothetical protein